MHCCSCRRPQGLEEEKMSTNKWMMEEAEKRTSSPSKTCFSGATCGGEGGSSKQEEAGPR
jgi:hypothetical protein